MNKKCDEIIKAFYMEMCDKDNSADCYLLYSPCPELYVTDGKWLILQTANDYCVVGVNGVAFVDNLDGYRFPEYDFIDLGDENQDPPITALETLLFQGEHLLNIENNERFYTLTFDHFTMRVYPFTPERFWRPWNQSRYIPTPCFDRLITRKNCACGGQPQIMLDHVDDFFIRCDRCHKATRSTWYLPSVIADWDSGIVPIEVDTGNEEFAAVATKKIDLIAMSKEHVCYDDNLYDCDSAIIVIGGKVFEMTSQFTSTDKYDFIFQELNGFNSALWPYRIVATPEMPIIYLGHESGEDQYSLLRYRVGCKELILTADNHGSITFGWVNSEWNNEPDGIENTLFNEVLC